MILSYDDGQLYYKLWLPLLDFVNRKYRVSLKLKKIVKAEGLDPVEVKKVANKRMLSVLNCETVSRPPGRKE